MGGALHAHNRPSHSTLADIGACAAQTRLLHLVCPSTCNCDRAVCAAARIGGRRGWGSDKHVSRVVITALLPRAAECSQAGCHKSCVMSLQGGLAGNTTLIHIGIHSLRCKWAVVIPHMPQWPTSFCLPANMSAEGISTELGSLLRKLVQLDCQRTAF